MTTQCYEFQEPANMQAIRSTIIQRIKKRSSINTQPFPVQKQQAFLGVVDSGLPSPPTESCTYVEEYPSDIILSPTSTLPPSPTLSKSSSSTTTTHLESADAIREKIKLLQQEKHALFQTMKSLLSQPTKAKPLSRSEFSNNRPRYRHPLVSRRNSSYVSSRRTSFRQPLSRY